MNEEKNHNTDNNLKEEYKELDKRIKEVEKFIKKAKSKTKGGEENV